MSKLPIRSARKSAVDYVIRAMRQEYATFLSELNDEDNGGALYLPTPQAENYFRAPPDPTDLVPTNAVVPVYVYPAGDRTVPSRSSGGVSRTAQTNRWQLEITLACMMAPDEPFEIDGHEVTSNERLWIRTELYTGAMIELIETYGRACEGITFFELIGDMPTLYFDQQRRVTGVATTRWQIEQEVTVPRFRSLPEEP